MYVYIIFIMNVCNICMHVCTVCTYVCMLRRSFKPYKRLYVCNIICAIYSMYTLMKKKILCSRPMYLSVCKYVCMYVCMYVSLCIYVSVCMYLYVCIYVCICMNICTV